MPAPAQRRGTDDSAAAAQREPDQRPSFSSPQQQQRGGGSGAGAAGGQAFRFSLADAVAAMAECTSPKAAAVLMACVTEPVTAQHVLR